MTQRKPSRSDDLLLLGCLTLMMLAVSFRTEAAAFAWGSNSTAQLGDTTTTQRNAPVAVVDANGVLAGKTLAQVSAGGKHSCALDSAGKAYCWGSNGNGNLGDNTTTQRSAPVAVVDANGVLAGKTLTQISVGSTHTCVLDSAGAAYCWGFSSSGQLGDNTTVQRNAPVAVVDANGVLAGKTLTQISAGGSYTCALDSLGAAYCWGNGSNGRLGDNTSTQRNAPVAVVDANGVLAGKTLTQISAGNSHTCALDSAGKAYCWGNNPSGQVGDNTTTQRNAPVAVVDANGVLAGKTLTQISAGNTHTCAVDSAGKAYCWGSGSNGRIGDNTGTQRNAPVAVVDINGVLAGKTLVQIGTGSFHTCALDSASAVYCWGNNGSAQLGDTTTTQRNAPVAVVDANGVFVGKTIAQISISQGGNHTLALHKLDEAPEEVINGACGTAHTVATSGAPTTLCTAGTASTPVSSNGAWGWMCNGSGTGATNATCSAPYASQTLSFGDAPTVVVDGMGTVSAQSTSGLKPVLSSLSTAACTLGTTSNNAAGVEASVTGKLAGTDNCSVLADLARSTDGCTSCFLAAMQKKQDISVGKGAQTLSFGDAPTVVVDDTGTVSATSNKNLTPVVFSSTTPEFCSVNGSTVSGLKAGTCTVAVNQVGDDNYNAAPQVTQNITIDKGAQTLTFGTAPTVVVDGSGTVSATSNKELTPVTFSSITPDFCSVSGSTVIGLKAGACTIAANQAGNANYNAASPVTQNITISKGEQTLSFADAPTVVVDGTGTLSASSNKGLTPLTFGSSTPSICTVSGATLTGVAAGTCTIAANQAGNDNYNAAPQVTQSFSIGKGSQSITGFTVPVSLIALGDDPSGALSATRGLSSGVLVFSSLSTSICTVSGSTVTAVAAGTCTVAADQAGDANYNVAPRITRTITVTAATVASAPQSLGVSAGDGRLELTFTASLSNGNASLSNHEYSLNGGSTWIAFAPAITSAPATIFGLTNGTPYAVRVRALNRVGAGEGSNTVTATPVMAAGSGITVPTAPTGLVASAGDGRIHLSFRPPARNGGAPVSNYEYALDGGPFVALFPAVSESPVVITGLKNGTLYSVRLRAVNSAGAGPESVAANAMPLTNAVIEDAATPPRADGVAGDGNGDGTPDRNQNNVASFPDAAGRYLTLVTATGTNITTVAAIARPADFPAFFGFSHSGVSFTAEGIAPGSAAPIELFFPASSNIGRLAKKNLVTGNYDMLNTRSSRVGDKTRVTFEIVDGGPYDSDGLANGKVVDPVFPLDVETGTPGTAGVGIQSGALNPALLILMGLCVLRRRATTGARS